MDSSLAYSKSIGCHDKYVVHYDFSDVDHEQAIEELKCVVRDLQSVGLETEVRAGYDKTLLIFVRVPKSILDAEVFKSRYVYRSWKLHPLGPYDLARGVNENLLQMRHSSKRT